MSLASQREVPLGGGRVSTGVVRLGDTVRKPVTRNSKFVRRLLEHLADCGSRFTPGFLGIDERDRDVFEFIDGEVPADLGWFDEATLRQAAELIRSFHDLTVELAGDAVDEATGVEVVCHNDLSPCNFVFRGTDPVAIIDFDAAAPGTREHDLGYAAWLWLDLGSPGIRVSEQRRRLETFLDAYGTPDIESVLGAMLVRQKQLIEEAHRIGDVPMADWATGCHDWTRRNLDKLSG